MNTLNNENTLDLVKYCDGLKRTVYRFGMNDSSTWFKKANIKQIDEILSKSFTMYTKNNDITFLYRGAEEGLKKAANHEWKEILEAINVSFSNPCQYVLIDLMQEYHAGLKKGILKKFYKVSDKFFDVDDDDYENDNDDDNDDF